MSAKINIAGIRSNVGLKEDFAFTLTGADLTLPDWHIADNLAVKGTSTNKGGYLLLEGEITGAIEGSCSRCLSTVRSQLEIPFSEKLLYEPDKSRFGSLAFGELEEEYTLYQGDEFDFSDLLIENIVDQLPSKILCRQDCRGLCPSCGHNLNESQCDCVFEDIDPRLAILEKLTYSD